MDKISFGFHAVGLAHHLYVAKFIATDVDFTKSTDPRIVEMQEFGPRYITSWNMSVQTIFLALSLWLDIARVVCKSKGHLESVNRIKGYIYTTLLFPLTLFVFTMFWTLYTINRDFVLPDAFEEVAPIWLNHSMHTNIMIVLIGELLISKRGFSTLDFKTAAVVLGAVGLVYNVQFFLAYYQCGRWMYGLFYHLTFPQAMFLMFGVNVAVSLLYMRIGFAIQRYKTYKYKVKA